MKPKTIYIALTTVFVGALVVTQLPVDNFVRTLAAVPAIGALLGALLQIARDRISYERSLLLLERQNSFSVGATSHMANVAFDKYVEFSEAYVSEVFETIATLFRRGSCKDAFEHANELLKIRRKWIVWLTPEVEATLEHFEDAIHKIGNCANLVEQVPGAQPAITQMYSLVAEVFGEKEWEGKPITGDIAFKKIIESIRKVLGIDELTLLRSELVKRAAEDLRNPR
jgi:hypothetical protein